MAVHNAHFYALVPTNNELFNPRLKDRSSIDSVNSLSMYSLRFLGYSNERSGHCDRFQPGKSKHEFPRSSFSYADILRDVSYMDKQRKNSLGLDLHSRI